MIKAKVIKKLKTITNKQKEKMNRRNERHIRAFNLQQFQEITKNYYISYPPQSIQNMMCRSYLVTHLF